ncbi:MAG TPA: hypothetical protein VMH83_12105 [Candidatus Acidoferrum sp.]|nr:hypothetical protein [Candidatus Acidoferrum sp.]
MSSLRLLRLSILLPLLLAGSWSLAQADSAFNGRWRINEGLSDNTDSQVEKAIRKAGEKVDSSWFDKRKDKYRGGPADQELYDRFSYDPVLAITAVPEGYVFEYADNFKSTVYTDNRSHSVSLNALDSSEDFLEGQWKDGKLQVEMHPRDGGYVAATYSLSDGGKRLHAEFTIKPNSFAEAIELERVYDRQK